MTIISIAKRGYAEMAVTGCIAEPLFNMLVGLGLSTIILNLNYYGGDIGMSVYDPDGSLPFMLVLGMLILIVFIIVMVVTTSFKFTVRMAKVKIGIYISIIAITII